MDAINIGNKIRSIRQTKKITQIEVATKMGIDNSQYSRIEKRDNNITVELLIEISKALDTDISLFFNEKKEASKEVDYLKFIINQHQHLIYSGIKHEFVKAFEIKYNRLVAYEEIDLATLELLYQQGVKDNYIVFYALKLEFIKDPILTKIFNKFNDNNTKLQIPKFLTDL